MTKSIRAPLPEAALQSLTPKNASYVKQLRQLGSAEPDPKLLSRTQAAVAILLYESGRVWDGSAKQVAGESSDADSPLTLPKPQLQVLMTTRSILLRSHPGQSSLPGGKVDRTDECVEYTALRESEEEVGLPQEKLNQSLFWLYTGEPFISKTCLLVHPVIFLLTDPGTTLPKLVACPTEVDSMWSFPLELFLSSRLPDKLQEAFTDPSHVDKHRQPQTAFRTYSDVPWLKEQPYRLHRFRTHRQLIKGLTADILIDAAEKVYGRKAAYAVLAPGQPHWSEWSEFVKANQKIRVSRWGDGESGDLLVSAHAFETVVGVDEDEGEEKEGAKAVHGAEKPDVDGTEATLLSN